MLQSMAVELKKPYHIIIININVIIALEVRLVLKVGMIV